MASLEKNKPLNASYVLHVPRSKHILKNSTQHRGSSIWFLDRNTLIIILPVISTSVIISNRASEAMKPFSAFFNRFNDRTTLVVADSTNIEFKDNNI